MNYFLQSLKAAATGKSKTININVLLTGLLVWYCETHAIPMDPATAALAVSALYAVVNVLMRFVTSKSLPEKGLTIPKPQLVDDIAALVAANPEAAERLAEQLLPALRTIIRRQQEKTP